MKTILIADDHDHLRLLVSTTLEGPDYRIIEARDGDEACALALTETPVDAGSTRFAHGTCTGPSSRFGESSYLLA